MKKFELSEGDWEVAKKRAEDFSEGYGIGILGRILTKEELLEELENKTDIGEIYAESQKEFLKWLVKRVEKSYA